MAISVDNEAFLCYNLLIHQRKEKCFSFVSDVRKTPTLTLTERFETFTVMISGISRAIRKIKAEEMAEYDLKTPHVSCIYYLYRSVEPMTAAELCECCDEDKAAISRSIEYLETNGFIKPREEKTKRYRTPLLLTEKGKAVGAKISNKINDILALSGNGLSDTEREEFYRALRVIHDNLNNICDSYDRN